MLTVDAGSDFSAFSGDTINLSGNVSDDTGSDNLLVLWEQFSGTEAEILSPETLDTAVDVPEVPNPIEIIFKLTASNGIDEDVEDYITVTLNPIPDTTFPEIELLGYNPVIINQGDTYIESGFIATDDIDGDITSDVVVSGLINTDNPVEQTITYTVSDSSGNTSSAERVVQILPVDLEAINRFSRIKFAVEGNGQLVAFKGASNITTIKFKALSFINGLELIDEFVDFSANKITRVDIYANGDRTNGISTLDGTVKINKQYLECDLGSLDINSDVRVPLDVAVYVDLDVRGVVISNQNLDNQLMIDYRTIP